MKDKIKGLFNKIKDFFKVKKHALYAGVIAGVILVFGIVILVTATASDAQRFKYELMEDGTYKVVDIKNTYRGGIFFKDDLVIPSEYLGKPVSTIAKVNSDHLTRITLSEGIEVIEATAFLGSDVLADIVLPNTLKSIGTNAFEDCPQLKNIYIPASVTTVGETIGRNNLDIVFYAAGNANQTNWNKNWNALGYDDNGYAVNRPAYFNVEKGSYYNVGNYEYLVSGNNVTITNCYSTETTITLDSKATINGKEYTVTALGSHAFDNLADLTNIVIPTTVTTLGDNVFDGCKALLHTHLGTNVVNVGTAVFKNCSSVVIYSEKAETASSTWSEDWNLWYITLEGGKEVKEYRPSYYNVGATDFETVDGYECIIDDNNDLTVVYYRLAETNVVVPATLNFKGQNCDVVNIGKLGFANQNKITSIELPTSIKSIGESAFDGCVALEKIYLSSSITSVGKNAFVNCVELIIYTANTSTESWGSNWNASRPVYTGVASEDKIVVVDNYFEYLITGEDTVTLTKYRAPYQTMLTNSKLKNIELNTIEVNGKTYKVTIIGNLAVENKLALNSVKLSENVKVIETQAFFGCTKVKTIELSKSIETIGTEAFKKVSGKIYYAGTEADLANVSCTTTKADSTVKIDDTVVYFYSETQPTTAGNFWHVVDETVTEWAVAE